MSKTELNKKLEILNNHQGILKSHHIKRVGIFGSAVKGELNQDSDLDILVEFEQSPSLFRFLALEEELSKLLGRKVDLVTKKALKPAIKKAVLKDVIYV